MSALIDLSRRVLHWSLRPFKSAARRWLRRQVRTYTQRYADDLVPLGELARRIDAAETRQSRIEAFRWDHVAMARRLAALEDHVEELLRRQAASAADVAPLEAYASGAVVSLEPLGSHRAAGGTSDASSRWKRA
jgi:hypothetical protein